MPDQKKVIRELRDVQDTMKRVEQRRTTTRFRAVKVPPKGDDVPKQEEAPKDEEPTPTR